MNPDVIVVGAGPAGLMLAGELKLAGVDVLILERLAEPTGQSRGLGFTARTMEVFDQRGILDRFGDVETSDVGHFGGIPLDFGLLPGAHFGAKTVPQARTEAVLASWVADLGVPTIRPREVTGVAQDETGVTVTAVGPDGPESFRAAWLVGCDGGRSTVRKAVNFDFPGTPATMEMYLADLRGIELKQRMIGETFPGGMVMSGQMPDGTQRIIVCERGNPPTRRDQSIEFTEVADAWKRLTGEDISHAEPVWLSSFGDGTRQVTEYRRGRVLLAGDAAHIHLPAGGQGMNTSIQDSVNLGWKLAAEVQGWAPPGLLDSYHTERHAVGKRLLMNTQAQGLLFLRAGEMQPLRDVMAELMTYREAAQHLIGMVSGLEITYEVGTGDNALLGKRLPNLKLNANRGAVSAYDFLHGGKGLFLDFGSGSATTGTTAAWGDRIEIVEAEPTDAASRTWVETNKGVLVRPDGHVCWTDPDGGDLLTALTRWFGEPGASRPVA